MFSGRSTASSLGPIPIRATPESASSSRCRQTSTKVRLRGKLRDDARHRPATVRGAFVPPAGARESASSRSLSSREWATQAFRRELPGDAPRRHLLARRERQFRRPCSPPCFWRQSAAPAHEAWPHCPSTYLPIGVPTPMSSVQMGQRPGRVAARPIPWASCRHCLDRSGLASRSRGCAPTPGSRREQGRPISSAAHRRPSLVRDRWGTELAQPACKQHAREHPQPGARAKPAERAQPWQKRIRGSWHLGDCVAVGSGSRAEGRKWCRKTMVEAERGSAPRPRPGR